MLRESSRTWTWRSVRVIAGCMVWGLVHLPTRRREMGHLLLLHFEETDSRNVIWVYMVWRPTNTQIVLSPYQDKGQRLGLFLSCTTSASNRLFWMHSITKSLWSHLVMTGISWLHTSASFLLPLSSSSLHYFSPNFSNNFTANFLSSV